MNIAGIQKLTLVDFPGRVAATVFTRGCSFRCGFCHNPELVLPEKFNPLLQEKQIFDFLESRYGKLTGICITGGEPCMQPDIDKFITHIKALGFDVKLDTNGSFPDRLEKIIKDGDVDYIAMDIKAAFPKYWKTAGLINPKSEIRNPKQIQSLEISKFGNSEIVSSFDISASNLNRKIEKSINLIMESGVPYEFRTTVAHPLHEVADFEEIGKMIKGAEKYYIQNFVKSKQINEAVEYRPFSDKELKDALKAIKPFVKSAEIR